MSPLPTKTMHRLTPQWMSYCHSNTIDDFRRKIVPQMTEESSSFWVSVNIENMRCLLQLKILLFAINTKNITSRTLKIP